MNIELINDSFEDEIWKDIPQFEGIYQASTKGRIRSLDRERYCRNKHTFLCKGKILMPKIQNSGYMIVWLRKDGKTYAKTIHRLIAKTFIPNPSAFEQVNHKDGNKINNNVKNLEWCSRSENVKHAYRVIHRLKPRSVKVQCVDTGEIFESIKEAEKAFGICRGAINQVVAGRHKTAGGLIWQKI